MHVGAVDSDDDALVAGQDTAAMQVPRLYLQKLYYNCYNYTNYILYNCTCIHILSHLVTCKRSYSRS